MIYMASLRDFVKDKNNLLTNDLVVNENTSRKWSKITESTVFLRENYLFLISATQCVALEIDVDREK